MPRDTLFFVTRRLAFALVFLIFAACKDDETGMASDPVSVRGWINDVAGAKPGETVEVEIARRAQLFLSTSVWVENSQYASGGIAENGSFIVLDVPPHNAILGFNAPGAESAQVVMKDVPGNADVFIPDIVLENGGAKVLDPKRILVRVPSSDVDKPQPTGKNATIAGYTVPVIAAPVAQFFDRRDYPNPGGFRPVATVK